MHSQIRQLLTLVSVVGFLAGCELDRPLAPDHDPALFAAGGSFNVAAPSNLTTSPYSHTEILLTWQDNSANESGFDVHRSTTGASGTFTSYTTTGPGGTTALSSGLAAATEFCYKVRAFVTKGRKTSYSAFSNVSCATTLPLPVPSAPSNTTAKPFGSTAVSVTWTAADGAQDGFRVDRSAAADGPWTTAVTTGATARSHYDWSVASEQPVCYRVIAFNGYGNSAPSAVDCTSPPAAPTALTAVAFDANTVDLTWADNSNVEDGYEIQRSGPDGVRSVLTTLPANAASYRDGGLNTDSRYTYEVVALKDAGYSDWSNQVAITTAATVAPSAPSDVNAAPASSSSVNVWWYASSVNTESFRVERSIDGQASWVSIGTTSLNETGFGDAGRSSEQAVCYRVFAVNSIGESAPSTADCTTPPAGPTGLVTVPIDEQTVEVRWTDNSGVEDGYELWVYYYDYYCYYNEAGEFVCDYYPYYYPLALLPPNTTSLQINAYENLYGVVAVKDGGYSDWLLASAPSAASLSTRASQQLQQRGAARRQLPPGVTPIREKPDKPRTTVTAPRR